jgi:sugar (pentulose or hexulose) kinase
MIRDIRLDRTDSCSNPTGVPTESTATSTAKGGHRLLGQAHARPSLPRHSRRHHLCAERRREDHHRQIQTSLHQTARLGRRAQSRTALQITADVFNLTVEVPSVNETGMLGAAMNAAVGLGYYPDYEAAVAGMTQHPRSHPAHPPQPRPVRATLQPYLPQDVFSTQTAL